jgi:hypothetical protein
MSQGIHPFIEPESSLLGSQEPTATYCSEAAESNPRAHFYLFKIDFNIIITSIPRSVMPGSVITIFYALIISTRRAICITHLILLHLITVITQHSILLLLLS